MGYRSRAGTEIPGCEPRRRGAHELAECGCRPDGPHAEAAQSPPPTGRTSLHNSPQRRPGTDGNRHSPRAHAAGPGWSAAHTPAAAIAAIPRYRTSTAPAAAIPYVSGRPGRQTMRPEHDGETEQVERLAHDVQVHRDDRRRHEQRNRRHRPPHRSGRGRDEDGGQCDQYIRPLPLARPVSPPSVPHLPRAAR